MNTPTDQSDPQQRPAGSWFRVFRHVLPKPVEVALRMLVAMLGQGLIIYCWIDAAQILELDATDPRMLGHGLMSLLGLAVSWWAIITATSAQRSAPVDDKRRFRVLTFANYGLLLTLWLVLIAELVFVILRLDGAT